MRAGKSRGGDSTAIKSLDILSEAEYKTKNLFCLLGVVASLAQPKPISTLRDATLSDVCETSQMVPLDFSIKYSNGESYCQEGRFAHVSLFQGRAIRLSCYLTMIALIRFIIIFSMVQNVSKHYLINIMKYI